MTELTRTKLPFSNRIGILLLIVPGMILSGCLVDSNLIATEIVVTWEGSDGGQVDVPIGETGQVVDIIDGDTIDVDLNGQIYRVRYIGINTPERDEPCYDDATQANADLVENQTVQLVQDVSNTDRFDRLLRYVYVGDLFVNAELVREGWAESVHYPPDTFHADTFDELADAARSANIGCWPTGILGP